jgi:hypothetical protein
MEHYGLMFDLLQDLLRRGFHDLGTDFRPTARLADAFAELALVV